MPVEDLEFDEALGRQGYQAHEQEAAALDASDLLRLGADPRKLAMVGLRVAEAIERGGFGGFFEAMANVPEANFDARHIGNLSSLSWALWHTHESRESASAATPDSQVKGALASEAKDLRALMLKVLTYHLEEIEEVGAALAVIRAGRGYLDMASDLSRLANLYRAHKATLDTDGHHYNPAHEAQARQLAAAIVEALSFNEEKVWIDRTVRIWTLLAFSYAEVKATADYLFRDEPERLALFPSLVGTARRL